jgi:hypothetical protein
MLSVTHKPFMLGVVMLSVIMVSVVMLNVVILSFVMLSVAAPPLKLVGYPFEKCLLVTARV